MIRALATIRADESGIPAGHYLWHWSQADHPLYELGHGDPLLRIYRAVDRAIGRIRSSLPGDAYFAVFAGHGMEANCMDLQSVVFLPELLYRISFPGHRGRSPVAERHPDERRSFDPCTAASADSDLHETATIDLMRRSQRSA